MPRWSIWRKFPDPKQCEMIIAPFGPGVYELRLNNELILVGIGRCCATRMASLLPMDDGGSGVRKNERKRKFVLENIGKIEYLTFACSTRNEAATVEREFRRSKTYKFPT
jgi:hypothetical protein